ncbi:hypothetical protein BGW80DRAFT_1279463 [Lactifluus volemus]|nr:hypothetical protein BGW80DRAFT_1279463 [Lactifluus volemus]
MLLYPPAFVAALVVPALRPSLVSASCHSSIAVVALSPNPQCLNSTGFISILNANTETSAIGPINTSSCSKDPWSNQTFVLDTHLMARQIMCLNDTEGNQFCAVDQLHTIQNQAATITKDAVLPFLPQVVVVITGSFPVFGPPLTSHNYCDGHTPGGISQITLQNETRRNNNTSFNHRTPKPLRLWNAFTIVAGLGVFMTIVL